MIQKLGLEAQKKFPAKNKMPEVSRDIQQANRMPITLKDVGKGQEYQVCYVS